MFSNLPRILYFLAALAWFILLKPYPVTVLFAGCTACLTLPAYKLLQKKFKPYWAIILYSFALSVAILIPIAVLVLLVAPQAAAGIDMFNQLREANFQLPPNWIDFFHGLRMNIASYSWLDKIVTDGVSHAETMIGDAVRSILTRTFSFVGGTVTALWLFVLFITIATLCVVYANRIHAVSIAILGIPAAMLSRFITAIRNALRGVMVGVIFVALVQGFLCGVGFSIAGVGQAAFWGLMASLVAPIPAVGTALVWVPICIVLWFTGKTVAAVGLFLWGTIAVAGIDTVLRPVFLRSGIDAPIFVLIISILCGLASMGAVGIITGPILLAFSIQAVKEGKSLLSHE